MFILFRVILAVKSDLMKKMRLLLPLLLLFFSSCKKIDQLLTFEIPNSENIKIPASGLINTPFISPVPVTMSNEQTFKNNNTSADLIKDVRLRNLTLTIVDPATARFDFLQSIKLYIGTDPSDKVLLASLDSVPTSVSTITLLPSNAKLDAYIKASSYTLYTEVAVRSTVAQELTVRADSRFQVTADPL